VRFNLVIALVVTASCARSHTIDVMTLPGVCDTIPPAAVAGPSAQLPTAAASRDHGAVVGTAVEAGTGRPLVQSFVSLYPMDSSARPPYAAGTDSLGGFVFRRLAPGTYTLRIRAIGHRLQDHQVDVRPGVVDTVRVALRYFTCVGY
jgi:Carboxypeptidase regulatory-like domain